MGYDPFSPLAPAFINVLCVPAGRISSHRFRECLEWLRSRADSAEAPSPVDQDDTRSEQPDGDVGSGTNCLLLFNFSQHSDGDLVQNISYFEPNRQAQLVLGLVDGSLLPHEDSDHAISILNDANVKLEGFVDQAIAGRPATKLVVFDSPNLEADHVAFVQTSDADISADNNTDWLTATALSAIRSFLKALRSEDVVLPSLAARFDRLNGAEGRRESKIEDVRRQSVTSTSSRGTVSTQVPNSISEENDPSQNSGLVVSSALLLLQQASWAQALYRFAEGARAARESIQYAWHAKALEGLLVCMILLAQNGHNFQIPQDCYPTGRGFSSSSAVHNISDANRTISEKFAGTSASRLQALTAMLPGLLATIMNLYDKAAAGYGDSFPKFFACEARVRLAAMLVIVKKHNSCLNLQALAELTKSRTKPANLAQLEPPTVSLILRSASLGQLLIESITEAQTSLPVQSASTVYIAVCKYLSQLSLDRKQGFYLKDVLQRLPPVFIEARRAGAAGVIVPTAASDKQQERVAHGVRALLSMTTQAYELPVGSGMLLSANTEDIQGSAQKRLASWYETFTSGDIATKLEVLRLCIRVAEALPDPAGSVQFMSLLLHIARQCITLSSRRSNAVPLISPEEQKRLITGIQNAVSTIQRLSSSKALAEYWDDFLVRDITLYENPNAGRLMSHTSRDLSLTSSTGTSKKDPFIYNPFTSSNLTTGPTVLVKDELASFEVVLQNPLETEIEVESIRLMTDGCDFNANTHNVVLAPLCMQVFTLKGTPRATGTLKITGCTARIKNCQEQNFAIFTGNWKPPNVTKKRNTSLADHVQLPTSTILELTITDPLPKIVINEANIPPRSVMLLDGEAHKFSLDLENTSDLDADLVLFSYEDSASKQLKDALATKDLQPADTYELQHQLTNRPAIRRVLSQDAPRSGRSTSVITARSKKTFEFSILGKPGLTEAIVLIDYAYIGKPRSEVEGTFYTRQMRFVINVTVNGSLDIPRCSVLSIPPSTTLPAINTITQLSEISTEQSSGPPPETCLLQLDLRSIWQTPLSITIETNPSIPSANPQVAASNSDSLSSSWTPTTTLTLLPAQITRTLIPVPKIYISNPFAPIPSLSTTATRQFVISASKLSLEADLAARESFWYRERLVSMLRVHWREEHGNRSGEIDVRRGIRLSSRMIDALHVEHVHVSFDLKAVYDDDGDATRRLGRSKENGIGDGNADFELKRNVFANLIVKVSNYTPDPLRLLLRLQPSLHNQPHNLAIDLTKKFVWSGILQQVFRTPVQPGESVEAELGIVGLVEGVYEVNATVEEVRARVGSGFANKNNGTGEGAGDVVEIGEKVERRIWHAKRPCLVRVVEGNGA